MALAMTLNDQAQPWWIASRCSLGRNLFSEANCSLSNLFQWSIVTIEAGFMRFPFIIASSIKTLTDFPLSVANNPSGCG